MKILNTRKPATICHLIKLPIFTKEFRIYLSDGQSILLPLHLGINVTYHRRQAEKVWCLGTGKPPPHVFIVKAGKAVGIACTHCGPKGS